MGVATHDNVYVFAQFVQNRRDFTAKAGARLIVNGRRQCLTALMDQHHHGGSALGLKLGRQAVDRGHLPQELQARHASGRDHRGGGPQGESDKADLHARHLAQCRGRKQRLAAGRIQHIGRQVLEFRAREAAGVHAGIHADHATGTIGRAWIAAPVLQALQLGAALVEFVVAHAGEIQANLVEHFDRGLIVEQARGERCGTHQIARAHDQGVARILALERLHQTGEVGRTACSHAGARGMGGIGHEHRARGRLDVAVEIVDGDQ